MPFPLNLLFARLTGPIATVVAVLLAVALGVTTFQKNAAVRRANGLYAEIHAPVTGFIARKAVCEANVKNLGDGLRRQNLAVEAIQSASDARVRQAEVGLAAAQHAAADARLRASRLASAQITGATPCERVLDADRQVQEQFQ